MPENPAYNKYCIHGINEICRCSRCDDLIAAGAITERKIYSRQRVWQMNNAAENRCTQCGVRLPDEMKQTGGHPRRRCMSCLSADAKLARRRQGVKKSKSRWWLGKEAWEKRMKEVAEREK